MPRWSPISSTPASSATATNRLHVRAPPPAASRSVRFGRSGLEITGIDRIVHGINMPVLSSIVGRAVLAAIVLGGLQSLIVGRADAPQVSDRPWLDATLGLVIGLRILLGRFMFLRRLDRWPDVASTRTDRTSVGRIGCRRRHGHPCDNRATPLVHIADQRLRNTAARVRSSI
jgi:hypothetical protein